jgi:protein TonB
MSLRIPVAFGIACLVTFGLFWVMQALVGVEGHLKEAKGKPRIEFVRLRKDTTPETKKREPPKREKPQEPPPPPDISTSKSTLDPGEGIAAIAPQIDAAEALSGGIGSAGGADRDVVPMVRIKPDYPMRARQRGIEGWVYVEFTISKIGSVKDVAVLSSEPGTVFDRATVTAVRKWKYNPKIKDGEAVERPGIRTTLEFSLED